MRKKTMILGIVPARSGSKGIPLKKIKIVKGKPLISYAIQCGLSCKSLDHVIVSTDSQEIAGIAKEYGADVPFIRPANLANDDTPMLPVLQHAILESERYYQKEVSILVLLDPTGPLRIAEDIEKAVKILIKNKTDAVISVNPAHRSPYFNMAQFVDDNRIDLIFPESNYFRRQDTPTVFDLNTVVWVYTRDALMIQKRRIPKNTLPYVIPTKRALDIDTDMDFQYLEFLLNTKKDVTN